MIPDDANAIKDSIDAKLGRRYQFEMFENFERCADVSKQEAHIIDLFLKLTHWLRNARKSFSFFMRDKKDLPALKQNTTRYLEIISQTKETIISQSSTYPKLNDFIGSIKALFILHYSYNINMTKAVLNGKLSYSNHEGKLLDFQV